MMKKMFFMLAVAATVVMAGASTAFAHGHGGGRSTSVQRTVCDVESCALAGVHLHDRVYYAAHYDGDGHAYHGICSVEDCTLTGYHEHDGTYCFGHAIAEDVNGSGYFRGGCHR